MALLASGFADPGRIRLLKALSNGPVCVGDLALALAVSQSSVSHQLRLLRSIGIVSSSRKGRHIYYSLAWAGAADLLERLERAVPGTDHRHAPVSTGDNTPQEEV
jgi:DNA-binding transcriptional ArsR family regulator